MRKMDSRSFPNGHWSKTDKGLETGAFAWIFENKIIGYGEFFSDIRIQKANRMECFKAAGPYAAGYDIMI